jgi:hypothetical protein
MACFSMLPAFILFFIFILEEKEVNLRNNLKMGYDTHIVLFLKIVLVIVVFILALNNTLIHKCFRKFSHLNFSKKISHFSFI